MRSEQCNDALIAKKQPTSFTIYSQIDCVFLM